MSRFFCLIGKHNWKDEDDLPRDCEMRMVSHRRICFDCGKRKVVQVLSPGHAFRTFYDSRKDSSVYGYEECMKCGMARHEQEADSVA